MKKVYSTDNGKFQVFPLKGTGSAFVLRDESSGDEDTGSVQVSSGEIGFALGTACMARNKEESVEKLGHFLSSPAFLAYRPFETNKKPGFCRFVENQKQKIFVSESFSFIGEASYFIDFDASHPICFVKLAADLMDVIAKKEGAMPAVLGFTGVSAFPEESVDAGENEKLFSIGICIHEEILKAMPEFPDIIDHFISFRNKGPVNFMVHSLFVEGINELPEEGDLAATLSAVPGKNRIDGSFYFGEELMINRARLWVFKPGSISIPSH